MTTATAAITTIPLTMSSREIAELTGKRHDNVVRDIEKMLNNVGMGLLKFEDTYTNPQNGQKYRCYNLPKNLTINLIAGYRDDMRLKIIDRWMELEAQEHKPLVPQTYAEALLEAGRIAKERDALKVENRELAVKGAALDRISTATGTHGLYEAAKILQVGPKKFVMWLASNQWIYKRTGSKVWLARQEKINAGYLWHKVDTFTDANGEERTRDTVKVLPKGLEKLAKVVPGAHIDADYAAVLEADMRPFAKNSETATM
ncbi:phage regulatory protein/antirepressor Ant [Komagataeibacter sp. FNDCF1]|uniref:phage regulatory protein/antirepressor Ant n=1 Tax=Komagataeibacter sp. FNDCF1 TaxID=2878681 RepID=UPI001E43CA99|nr:phage regulatory protein/antirepressor Ant [Komagataeibacter sp. FNDCF1]MCE2563389.1 phage regulatory protein/antirepressor Ant [Komagataeibacter sp. FNDCF1]